MPKMNSDRPKGIPKSGVIKDFRMASRQAKGEGVSRIPFLGQWLGKMVGGGGLSFPNAAGPGVGTRAWPGDSPDRRVAGR